MVNKKQEWQVLHVGVEFESTLCIFDQMKGIYWIGIRF